MDLSGQLASSELTSAAQAAAVPAAPRVSTRGDHRWGR
jgi:hypothetical protein